MIELLQEYHSSSTQAFYGPQTYCKRPVRAFPHPLFNKLGYNYYRYFILSIQVYTVGKYSRLQMWHFCPYTRLSIIGPPTLVCWLKMAPKFKWLWHPWVIKWNYSNHFIVGAVIAGYPLATLGKAYGWHTVFLFIQVVGGINFLVHLLTCGLNRQMIDPFKLQWQFQIPLHRSLKHAIKWTDCSNWYIN